MASSTDSMRCVRLTAREHEVVQRILRRETIKEIAQRIGKSPKTAEFHVRNVLWKLGFSSRKELAAAWVLGDLGIIDVDEPSPRR
jgi:DNA-binding CsgD family transcriptional regulator